MTVIVGTALCLGQLLHDRPERDDAQATDQVTEDLLRMLGVPAHEAHDISRRPLPDLDDPTQPHPRPPQRAEHPPGPPARPTPVTTRQTKTRTA
jgi:hypothetical protein